MNHYPQTSSCHITTFAFVLERRKCVRSETWTVLFRGRTMRHLFERIYEDLTFFVETIESNDGRRIKFIVSAFTSSMVKSTDLYGALANMLKFRLDESWARKNGVCHSCRRDGASVLSKEFSKQETPSAIDT